MTERLVQFGPDNGLVGTVTLPEPGGAAATPPLCFMFVNAGFVHRVGPHRLNVRLARYFARHGFAGMRFDFSNLGDSSKSPGGADQKQRMLAEVSAAMTAATAQTGAQRFVMVGLCSGTDPCIWAAMQDDRVVGAILLDPFAFKTWRTRFNHLIKRARARGTPLAALVAAVRSVTWTIAKTLKHPTRSSDGVTGEFIVRPLPTRQEFESWFQTMFARNVRTFVLYSGNFPAWYNYEGQFVERHGTFGNTPLLTHGYVPTANHTFTDLTQQAALFERLLAWVKTFA